jgi:lipoprotein-anchoring transpeptidase ErfK/SrfK
MRRLLALATTLSVTAAPVAGCGDPQANGPPASSASPTPTGAAPSPTVTEPSPTSPTASPTSSTPSIPPPAAARLRWGDTGEQVRTVQQRLESLGYWVGPVDGVFGPLTRQAVYAVQKAAGISRDGVVGPDTRSALDRGVRPPARSDGGHVIEVDLDKQLLMLVDNGRVDHIFNTSTGTFEYYWYGGERHFADTPRGRWEIYRQVDGWDPGPLGRLYKPKYFNQQGIAVHGYTNVPPYPASHGCVRVSLSAIDWMWRTDQLPIGATVLVY